MYAFTFEAELGTFFDLRNFPYDRQVVALELNFRSGTFELSPLPFEGVPAKWGMHSPVAVTLAPRVGDEYSLCTSQPFVWDVSDWKPAIRVMLERDATPWIFNFVTPTFFFVATSGSILSIEVHDVAGRSSMLVTLMLTLVALKFSMASALPATPYLTLLDKELLVGNLLLCALLMSACISHQDEHRRSEHAGDEFGWLSVDLIATSCAAMVWVPMHAYALCFNMRRPWDQVIRDHGRGTTSVKKATELNKDDILYREGQAPE
jgi:hypothetical protein